MKNKKRLYGVMVLCFVMITSFTFIVMYSELHKYNNKVVGEVNLPRVNYSVYLQKNDGTYDNVGINDKWGTYEGTHKYSKSECVNESGVPLATDPVTFIADSNITVVNVTGSVYCKVYFDQK